MAPPLGFVFSRSAPTSLAHASTTEANASLISNVSMSPIDRPVRSSRRCVASIGPVSMSTGSTPTRQVSTMRARGVRPSSLAAGSVIISTAAAPSEICDELPAVCTPSSRATGFSVASFSSDVSRRPSSRCDGVRRAGRLAVLVDVGGLDGDPLAVVAALGPRPRPPAAATPARSASVSSRVMPHFSAMRSAPSNCDVIS